MSSITFRTPLRRCIFIRNTHFFNTRRHFGASSAKKAARPWKSTIIRWGIAIGGLYYYNTSSLFAEDPEISILKPTLTKKDTVETSIYQLNSTEKDKKNNGGKQMLGEQSPEQATRTSVSGSQEPETGDEDAEIIQGENASGQQEAFNPETGEINWDCPCLGGMAQGPCGEEFKAAFSCFVHSKEEPKGVECIEKFKNMQECFRQHPDIYGAELGEDESEEANIEGQSELSENSDKTGTASEPKPYNSNQGSEYSLERNKFTGSDASDEITTSKVGGQQERPSNQLDAN